MFQSSILFCSGLVPEKIEYLRNEKCQLSRAELASSFLVMLQKCRETTLPSGSQHHYLGHLTFRSETYPGGLVAFREVAGSRHGV